MHVEDKDTTPSAIPIQGLHAALNMSVRILVSEEFTFHAISHIIVQTLQDYCEK